MEDDENSISDSHLSIKVLLILEVNKFFFNLSIAGWRRIDFNKSGFDHFFPVMST